MRYNFRVADLKTKLEEKAAYAVGLYRGKKIAVGVSGGRDSMCLLHALVACGATDKSDILAVHVNHNLRETAKRDEDFVRTYCTENGIRFSAYSVSVTEKAKRDGLTTEQAARDLRYDIFYGILKSGEADVVFTAHHALDNAESILMHMFRGAGMAGLAGMSNDCTDVHTGIFRPFLDVYPEELDEYALARGITYVTDETNFDAAPDRNFVRLEIIPRIRKRYPGAVRAINALSKECAQKNAFIDSALNLDEITTENGAAVISERALKGPLACEYVRRALKSFTLTDVTREDIEKTARLIDMRCGAEFTLKHGICAVKEYGGVALYVKSDAEPFTAEVELKAGANYIDGLAVDVEKSDGSPLLKGGGAVDLGKLDGAVLRFRRDGDVFSPFGGGSKKLKSYFIDKKIPKRLRDRIPLVCRGNEVLVVVGYEISEKVKQTDGTKQKYTVRKRW